MRTRDKLIHHYESMEPAEIWQAVQQDIPVLLKFLNHKLAIEEGRDL